MATRFLKESDFLPLQGGELPGLYLGISYSQEQIVDEGVVLLRFFERKRWKKVLRSPGSGFGVKKKQFLLCTRVKTSKSIDDSIKAVIEEFSPARFSGGELSLSQISIYNNALSKHLSAGCNYSFKNLSNGFFPIDISFLDNLSQEKFPKDLDEMVSWDSGFQRCAGSQNRWGLWILI